MCDRRGQMIFLRPLIDVAATRSPNSTKGVTWVSVRRAKTGTKIRGHRGAPRYSFLTAAPKRPRKARCGSQTPALAAAALRVLWPASDPSCPCRHIGAAGYGLSMQAPIALVQTGQLAPVQHFRCHRPQKKLIERGARGRHHDQVIFFHLSCLRNCLEAQQEPRPPAKH